MSILLFLLLYGIMCGYVGGWFALRLHERDEVCGFCLRSPCQCERQ